MTMSDAEYFDLVLLGPQSALPQKGIDQRIGERFPNLATLKIEVPGEPHSICPTRITDSLPQHVIEALHEMLGEDATLIPVELPLHSDQSPSA
jgi:hypothetical protein